MVATAYHDRIREYTTTGGTGTLTLSGAVIGYRTFSMLGNNRRCHYLITNEVDFEIGLGTYNTGTLTREQVFSSSNGNNLVDWPTTSKRVSLTVPSRMYTAAVGVYRNVGSSLTLDDSASIVLCDNSSDITLTLPPLAGYAGFPYLIKKVGNNTAKITIDGNDAETIEGSTTLDLHMINDQVQILPDDTQWRITYDGLQNHRTKLIRSTAQSIPNFTTTRINLNVARYDRGGVFSSSDFGFKIKRAGEYHLTMSMGFTSGVVSSDELWIAYKINSVLTQWQLMSTGADSAAAAVTMSETINLAVNDIVTMFCWHGLSGSKNTETVEQYLPKASLEEVR